MRLTILTVIIALAALPAAAEGFAKVNDKEDFVSLIEDRKLTRMGIRLTVTPTGQIVGRAFGRPVTGAWQWQSGFFCRDLFWGKRNLGENCQEVKVQGERIRFTSDRGTGEFADLILR